MDVAKSMRDNNPGMEALDKNIAELKQSILASLRIYENSVKTQLSVVENKQQQSNSRLNQLPKQESGFRKIARQQQIVESIYLYLLQKREEAEITASATIEGVKIIDWAFSNKQPVSPKPPIIILGSVILGLLIPTVVIYAKTLLDNKVKDQKDIKKYFSGSILGDIPSSEEVLIQQNDRSSLAEAFRILRTNLNFLLPNNQQSQVIYITSTISGEGKTFTAV